MKYQHHTKQQLIKARNSLKFTLSSANPFKPNYTPSERRAKQAELDHLTWLINNRKF